MADRLTDATRAAEADRYRDVYQQRPEYAMSGQRKTEAMRDVDLMQPGARLVDVGCGRGEIVDYAHRRGLRPMGVECVPELCDGRRIVFGDALELPFKTHAFAYGTCFDVLEHLPPGDEQQAVSELLRVSTWRVVVTVNNRPSVSRVDGQELHINKRQYSRGEPFQNIGTKVAPWDELLMDVANTHGWLVQRIGGKQYVSATFYLDSPASPHRPTP